MKNAVILSGLCLMLIGLPSAFRKPAVSRVIINSPDSVVKSWSVQVEKTKRTAPQVTYYWCDNNLLHHTDGAYSGKLLHGSYESKYSNGQLKSNGTFRYGVKTGEWKQWYSDGRIKETVSFSDGKPHGSQTLYTYSPDKTVTRKFRNGKEAVKKQTSEKTNDSLQKNSKFKHVRKSDTLHNRKSVDRKNDSVRGSEKRNANKDKTARSAQKIKNKDTAERKNVLKRDSASTGKQKK